MSEEGLLRPSRGECVVPTELFQRVIHQVRTALSIALYVAPFLELLERVYTILSDFGNPSNDLVFHNFNITFDLLGYSPLAGRLKMGCFRAVLETLDRTAVLNADEEADWKEIIKFSKQKGDVANRRSDIVRFSITIQCTV